MNKNKGNKNNNIIYISVARHINNNNNLKTYDKIFWPVRDNDKKI